MAAAGVFAAGAFSTRADELHIGRLDVERVTVVAVAVRPLFYAKTSLDVDGRAFCEIFRGVLSLVTPERDLEPSGDVLELAGLITAFLVRGHGEAADGGALRRVAQFGIA